MSNNSYDIHDESIWTPQTSNNVEAHKEYKSYEKDHIVEGGQCDGVTYSECGWMC